MATKSFPEKDDAEDDAEEDSQRSMQTKVHKEMAIATDRGGYEYVFVDPPSDTLVCKICQCPSKEPHLSECCGHTFCKSCLDGVKKAATVISAACPICRKEEFITFVNKQADRAIRSLHVFCTNKKKGCEWQGEVNSIINHRKKSDGCPFEEVTCSNVCGQTLQRQDLTNHVEYECSHRKATCQYCHIIGQHQSIEGEHKQQCPKFPITCPNKCEVGSVPREVIEEHIKMCPLELIQCEYHVVGCEERMTRKDQKEHNKEKMEEHLSLTTHQLTNTSHKVASIQLEAVDCKEELMLKISQTKSDLAVYEQKLAVLMEGHIATQQETRKDVHEDVTQQFESVTQDLTKSQQDISSGTHKSIYHCSLIYLLLLSFFVVLLAWFIHYEKSNVMSELVTVKGQLKSIEEELSMFKKEVLRTKDKITPKLSNTTLMPCQNDGTCADGMNTNSCAFVTGFNGTNCENNIDECALMPCQNDGTCTDGINMYRCVCAAGFTGTDCQISIDDCDPNPCKNGGTCTDGVDGFICECNPVYSGIDCSGCAMLNCEQCKESDKNEMGECTECAGMFVLNEGTCKNNCSIPNCIVCNVVTNKCEQCEEGYSIDESEGKCEEETPKVEGHNDDGLGAGSIGLLILILGTIAIIVIFIFNKHQKHNIAENIFQRVPEQEERDWSLNTHQKHNIAENNFQRVPEQEERDWLFNTHQKHNIAENNFQWDTVYGQDAEYHTVPEQKKRGGLVKWFGQRRAPRRET